MDQESAAREARRREIFGDTDTDEGEFDTDTVPPSVSAAVRSNPERSPPLPPQNPSEPQNGLSLKGSAEKHQEPSASPSPSPRASSQSHSQSPPDPAWMIKHRGSNTVSPASLSEADPSLAVGSPPEAEKKGHSVEIDDIAWIQKHRQPSHNQKDLSLIHI
eukprot:TRINITY_DN25832_c0_g1_i2.p1 TRINITY_DN25832_c0_g1~~TRINITY_DN25832_c0_g1_i2.p1  ORF type:complete len:161 (+),score=13.07 TRINITY_DN25832_c0_g1_i2:180-662(+)